MSVTTSSSKENSAENPESISVIDHSMESINNTSAAVVNSQTTPESKVIQQKVVLHHRQQELMIHRQDKDDDHHREASSSSSSSPISSSYRQAMKTSTTLVATTATSDRSEEDEEDEEEDVTEGVLDDPSLVLKSEEMTSYVSQREEYCKEVEHDQENLKGRENVFPVLTSLSHQTSHQQLEKQSSGNRSPPSSSSGVTGPPLSKYQSSSYSSIKCDIVEYL
jgi:hypothetical protein